MTNPSNAPTPAERAEAGRAARKAVPRSSLADIGPAEDRDPIGVLTAQAESRVPQLLPIRYGRMVASPFTFYRGAAAVMAADVGGTVSTGLRAQLCGDAHLSNFGAFASPERRLVFDVNDFDETLPGPFEWDVKRLVASMVIAARSIGASPATGEEIARACAARYRGAMRYLATVKELDVWYARIDVDALMADPDVVLSKRARKRMTKAVAKAKTKDSEHVFAKIATTTDGIPRIVPDPPLIVSPSEVTGIDPSEIHRRISDVLDGYARTLVSDRRHLLGRFRLVDFAHKVVGVGSVGTRAWIALMMGRDGDDPLFLQVKEATASVLEPYAGRSAYRNAGHRVVAGQRLMQAASDIFLGYQRVVPPDGRSHDYYVRQLKDWKGSAQIEVMRPDTLGKYGELCADTLARAHARSADRIAIAAYLGKGDTFDRALAAFGRAYADRNVVDHAALRAAIDEGRIPAQEGV